MHNVLFHMIYLNTNANFFLLQKIVEKTIVNLVMSHGKMINKKTYGYKIMTNFLEINIKEE